jgi:hypothetical protein
LSNFRKLISPRESSTLADSAHTKLRREKLDAEIRNFVVKRVLLPSSATTLYSSANNKTRSCLENETGISSSPIVE